MLIDRELMARDLAEHLAGREGSGLVPRSEKSPLKTNVVEAHGALRSMLRASGSRQPSTGTVHRCGPPATRACSCSLPS
jgi:hypothetical protein